jgi:hypothetical protein
MGAQRITKVFAINTKSFLVDLGKSALPYFHTNDAAPIADIHPVLHFDASRTGTHTGKDRLTLDG